MKNFVFALTILLVASQIFATVSPRTTQLLENGWKFHEGEVENGEKKNLDVSQWESVRVPHDWAIRKHFDMNIDYQLVKVVQDGDKKLKLRTGRTGALPCFGIGWYRIDVDVDLSQKDNKVFLEFDGAMSNAKIFVNGEYAGEWPFGYASFEIDATKFIKFGEKNLIAVRLDNKELSSRWYSGAGLYRNVRIVYKNPVHLVKDGLYITTPLVEKDKAKISVKTEISKPELTSKISHKVIDADEKILATKESTDLAKNVDIDLNNPKLWSPETPKLYVLETSLFDKNGKEVDRQTTRFGIRSLEFSREKGFLLNGEKTIIKGVCMHHDLGPLGAATNVRALRRQLEILKDMGCNAIRTSHNPPSPELLNLCDEMGFLVQDEAFDEWKYKKCENGYNTLFEKWAQKDLLAFVRRDRNHPSVFMWSIGNEINDQRYKGGGATARFLKEIIKREDITRPVTQGLDSIKNAFEKSKIAQELDVIGLNYRPFLYSEYAKKYPNMIFHGSETASTVSSRGSYHFPAKRSERDEFPFHEDYQTSSYDLETPPWGQIPDEQFAALDDNPEYFGEFVWTGFDYLGEPTPYNPGTPARSSYFGIVDLAGMKKDRFYLYQSRWNPEAKVLHILPHWNWEDRIGQKVPIHCYTSYNKVELFVNGKSMGIKEKKPTSSNCLERYRLIWEDVIYQAGEIKAVALSKDGKRLAEKVIKTAGVPQKLKFTTDRNNFEADPKELIFIEIDVVDKDENFCPRASRFMFVEVKGEGKLKALCNGDPTDHTPFSSNYMKSFNGKLLAVIEPTENAGEITITAFGMSLKPSELKIKSESKK